MTSIGVILTLVQSYLGLVRAYIKAHRFRAEADFTKNVRFNSQIGAKVPEVMAPKKV